MNDNPDHGEFREHGGMRGKGAPSLRRFSLASAPRLMVVAGAAGVVLAMIAGNNSILIAAVVAAAAGLILAVLLRQQATQRALRDSETRFRALSALGSDWYWEADSEYRFTHVSDGLCRLTGRAISEFLGQPCWHHAFVTPVGTDWSAHKR